MINKGQLLSLILFLAGCSGAPIQDNNVPVGEPAYRIPQSLKNGILLQGTIVTPDEIIPDGWVFVKDEKIVSISILKPPHLGAIELNTNGIIFPGLIDLHNHVAWNVIPRWKTWKKFKNRYDWNIDPDYEERVRDIHNNIEGTLEREMNIYGEIRSLIGGTTSIIGSPDLPSLSADGFLRNLDFESGFVFDYRGSAFGFGISDPDRVYNEIKMNYSLEKPVCCEPCDQGVPLGQFLEKSQSFLSNWYAKLFLIHLSEGIDPESQDEFCYLKANGLLTSSTGIVHGTALNANHFQQMAESNSSLIWSPKSNLSLYGKTTNIKQALSAGVASTRMALSADWSISGSNNLLYELRFAHKYNHDSLNNIFTDEQLVKMATKYPAQIAGLGNRIGSIQEGYYADLLVISGNRDNPYNAITQAEAKDVQLVLISGQPLYGDRALMNKCWGNTFNYYNLNDPTIASINYITLNGAQKAIKMPVANSSFFNLCNKLNVTLNSFGSSLAPLVEAESGQFFLNPSLNYFHSFNY